MTGQELEERATGRVVEALQAAGVAYVGEPEWTRGGHKFAARIGTHDYTITVQFEDPR